MDCSCAIMADVDDDFEQVSSTSNPRARKTHVCCECHRTINIGEQYELYKGLWDGNWDAYKTCIDCKSVRDVLFCSWTYEIMWDDIADQFRGGEPPSSDCMIQLTKPARDKLCDIIEDGWR